MFSISKNDLKRIAACETAVREAFRRGLTPEEAVMTCPEACLSESEWAEAVERWCSLFASSRHHAQLLAKRRAALDFMRRMSDGLADLLLAGRVAAGTATESSPVLVVARSGSLREAAVRLLDVDISSDPIAAEDPEPDPMFCKSKRPCGLVLNHLGERIVLRLDLPEAPWRPREPLPPAPSFVLRGNWRGIAPEALAEALEMLEPPRDPQEGLPH